MGSSVWLRNNRIQRWCRAGNEGWPFNGAMSPTNLQSVFSLARMLCPDHFIHWFSAPKLRLGISGQQSHGLWAATKKSCVHHLFNNIVTEVWFGYLLRNCTFPGQHQRNQQAGRGGSKRNFKKPQKQLLWARQEWILKNPLPAALKPTLSAMPITSFTKARS